MNRIMNQVAIIGVLLVFFGLMMGSKDASGAETPEHFYKGKTIHWIIVTEAGGSTDVYVRTIAPFLTTELGASRATFENRKADEGFNYLYRQVAQDGLTMGVKSGEAIVANDIQKAPGVRYDTNKFNFVADIFPSMKVCHISPKLPFRTLDGLNKAKRLRVGATTARGSMAMTGATLLEILGLYDGKIVSGLSGKKSVILALARGEIDLMVCNDNSAKQDEQDGYVVNLLTFGDRRSAVVPNIPTLSELGVKIPKEFEGVYEFVTLGGLAVTLPPGVPPERVEYMRRAFQNISSNNELRNSMKKLGGASIPFLSGKEVQEKMAKIKSSEDLPVRFDALFKKYTAVQ